jgi:hypothetical protein
MTIREFKKIIEDNNIDDSYEIEFYGYVQFYDYPLYFYPEEFEISIENNTISLGEKYQKQEKPLG